MKCAYRYKLQCPRFNFSDFERMQAALTKLGDPELSFRGNGSGSVVAVKPMKQHRSRKSSNALSDDASEPSTASMEERSDWEEPEVTEFVEAEGCVRQQSRRRRKWPQLDEITGPILDFSTAQQAHVSDEVDQKMRQEALNAERKKEQLRHEEALARMEMEANCQALDLQANKRQLRMAFVLECAKQGKDVDAIEKLVTIAFPRAQ